MDITSAAYLSYATAESMVSELLSDPAEGHYSSYSSCVLTYSRDADERKVRQVYLLLSRHNIPCNV
jgi:hypothetical protein